jgi:hypothetical protein
VRATFAQGVGADLLGAGVTKPRLLGADLGAKVFSGSLTLEEARMDDPVVNLAEKLPRTRTPGPNPEIAGSNPAGSTNSST